MNIRLSPTSLRLFENCPRCFWQLFKTKKHRPKDIFPSLPNGMDRVIKEYFDRYRAKGVLPPELVGKMPGVLVPDLRLIKKWRHWQHGLTYEDQVKQATLSGALDDCLVDNGLYLPLDYKTRGYPPKTGDSELYYGLQLNCYAMLLQANGYPPADNGFLVYYYPTQVRENGVV
ncbi:MAG: PD-(D/E)XK nuclease family protein [Patescibacteria group bacterium]